MSRFFTLFASPSFKSIAPLFELDGSLGLRPTPVLPATGSLAAVEVDDGDGNAVVVVVGGAPPARFPSAVVMESWVPSSPPLK